MRISEALNQVSQMYEPGLATYYEKLQPDPWLEAHDNLNSVLVTKNNKLIKVATQMFVTRCRQLVDRYKLDKKTNVKINIQDAFYIGDPKLVDAEEALTEECCYICESKENLKLIKNPNNPKRVTIVCNSCDGK